jgi:hypothetical protein
VLKNHWGHHVKEDIKKREQGKSGLIYKRNAQGRKGTALSQGVPSLWKHQCMMNMMIMGNKQPVLHWWSSGLLNCEVFWLCANVSEEPTASIIRATLACSMFLWSTDTAKTLNSTTTQKITDIHITMKTSNLTSSSILSPENHHFCNKFYYHTAVLIWQHNMATCV